LAPVLLIHGGFAPATVGRILSRLQEDAGAFYKLVVLTGNQDMLGLDAANKSSEFVAVAIRDGVRLSIRSGNEKDTQQ
jgi:hypothetical protein